MSDLVPLRFLRKSVAPEKVLQIIAQRECEHTKVTPVHFPGDWNHDPEDFFVCDECSMSFDHDPNEKIDLDEVGPDFESEIKQVTNR